MNVEPISDISTEYVSLGEDGVIMLSPEAEAAMNHVEEPVIAEEKPAVIPTEEAVNAPVSARTIKWNGAEVEVKPEQEVELLQKGYNYEQKMAALEAERAKLAAYTGLVSAIETSPDIKAKVAAALGHAPAPQVQETPQFDDPIEQLKWETRQEVMREVEEKFIKPMQTKTQMTEHQMALNQVRQQVQADPQFSEVQAAIIEQIKALPEVVGKNLYLQLDQDPASYLEMFKTVKARIATTPTNTTQLPTDTQTSAAPPPTPEKRATKAPLLEGTAQQAPDATAQKAQADHIKSLEKKARAGDYRAAGELMELLA